MKYLVLEGDRPKIVSGKYLRNWLNHTKGKVRIFRICGLNDLVELFPHFLGNGFLLVDRFGNNEGV